MLIFRKFAEYIALLVLLGGCSWHLPWSQPEPQVVTVEKLWCPKQAIYARPDPIDAEAPNFLVLPSGEKSDIALVCMASDGYQSLADYTSQVVEFATDANASLDAYEQQAERANQSP